MSDAPKQEVAPAVKTEEGAAPAATTAPLSVEEAEKETFRQIEFYFSDVNLPFDKFLWTLTRQNDGWVPLATLASFKRMRPMRDALGEEGIAKVMKASEFLELDEDAKKIRRKSPIQRQTDSYERSIYAKGFPEETETLQQELEKFFAQFGQINVVRMRREELARPKKFKGSVFVEFASMDEATKFLSKGKAEEGIKFGEAPLLVMSKDEYCQMKMKEKGIDPQAQAKRAPSGKAPISRPGKFNAFTELAREEQGLPSSDEVRAQNAAAKSAPGEKKAAKPKRSDPLTFEFNDKMLVTREDETVDPATVEFPERSVIAFEGAGENGNWRELKESLLQVAPTSFVEFPAGATSGAAGFKSTLSDEDFDTIVAKDLKIGDKPLKWSRVEEDRARQFYVDRANFRAKVMLDRRELPTGNGRDGGRGGRGGGRGGRGGRGGGRGGRGGRGGGGRGGGRGDRDRGGEKRKRNGDEEFLGAKGGGEAPSLASKKTKTEGD